MALVLKIAGTDRSSSVNWPSLTKTEVLSKEVDRMEFKIRKTSGSKYIPTVGQEIVLEEDTIRIFGGIITEIREEVEAGILLAYLVRCKDYSHFLDRKLATKTYSNAEAGDIIADLVSTYTSGFTTTNVPATSPTIASMKFNYEQITRCFTKVADTIGWDWYVDYNKDIHFFNSELVNAPFNITDSNDKLFWDSLEINQTILQVRNVVFVRGGDYKKTILEADAIDDYRAASGQKTFPLAYKYDDITVKLNNVVQTIGTDQKDDPGSVDVLYNFSEKFITFSAALTAGDQVEVFGDAYIPIIAQARDQESVVAYGEYQTVVVDKNITSITEAQLRAKTELAKYAATVHEGSFKTTQTGLKVGQRISVTLSTNRTVNKTFKINRIVGKARSSGTMEYTVYLIASGQITLNDVLIELLERDKQNIVIAPYEVIQYLDIMFEEMAITDATPSVTTDSPPYTYDTGNTGAYDKATWT